MRRLLDAVNCKGSWCRLCSTALSRLQGFNDQRRTQIQVALWLITVGRWVKSQNDICIAKKKKKKKILRSTALRKSHIVGQNLCSGLANAPHLSEWPRGIGVVDSKGISRVGIGVSMSLSFRVYSVKWHVLVSLLQDSRGLQIWPPILPWSKLFFKSSSISR